MRESRLEKYFSRRVKDAGGEVRKLAWLGRRHAPDRAVLWYREHDLVEIKAPGEKPRPGQLREHVRLRRAGFNVFVLASHMDIDVYITHRTGPQ